MILIKKLEKGNLSLLLCQAYSIKKATGYDLVKKGDKFQTYSDKLKIQVVKSYLNGEGANQL